METKCWHNHYDPGVPHTLEPYPKKTLLDVVRETARQQPDHAALCFKGKSLSYSELNRLSDVFAAGLIARGVKKGDRVALLLPNCPQAVIAQLGAWKARAIVVPLNPNYTERELEELLSECGAQTIITLTPWYGKVKSLQPRTVLRHVIVTGIAEYLPCLLRFFFKLFNENQKNQRVVLVHGDTWMSDVLRKQASASLRDTHANPADAALILFTGGTTGIPKGAVATHQSLVMAAGQLHAWFGNVLRDWKDSVVLLMPIFHVYGNIGVLGGSLIGHNTLILIPDPRDLKDLISTIRRHRPAFLPAVPSLLSALINHSDVRSRKVDFSSIKLCISGGVSLLAETRRRFESLTGGRIVEGYALTESMEAAVVEPVHGRVKTGSVGLPLPDVEIRIVDKDNSNRVLAANEVGEILMRAPQMMREYWQRPEETAQILCNGWLHTGDIGYMDNEGYLFILDRKKDLIKPGGFQVWPREIEAVIASHPAVSEVCVAGIPDAHQGEAVYAWVVLRVGCSVVVDDLRAHCRQKLIAYKIPRQFEFRENLPMTAVGKVSRRALVEERASKTEVIDSVDANKEKLNADD